MRGDPDLERKMPVWWALSDFFLDTELMPEDYDRMARVLNDSGYTREQLWRILDREVAPRFADNFLSAAGEWAGWDIKQVRRAMSPPFSRPVRDAVGRLAWLLVRRQIRTQFEERLAPLLDDPGISRR